MTAHRDRPSNLADPTTAVAAPSEESAEHGSLVVVQERVLAEISHELGNFFHKLYYWSDYIKSDSDAARKADSTAGHMLERTISNLEDFLKVALEYFYPIRLNFTKIAVGELLDGFMTHLSAHLNGAGTIRRAEVSYRVQGEAYTWGAVAALTPAARVAVTAAVDTQIHYLPPGVSVDYYWTLEDDAGHRFDTAPAQFRYDDGRFAWQTRAAGNVQLLRNVSPERSVLRQ